MNPSLYVLGRDRDLPPILAGLIDMLAYARHTTIESVRGLSVEQLDRRHDAHSNSIGALLAHIAAVEAAYQIETLGGPPWNEEEKARFETALDLGPRAAAEIRGQPLEEYLQMLARVRARTVSELRRRDEAWLLAVQGDANNYWKWFHVCEDEINHRGQIRWLRKRL